MCRMLSISENVLLSLAHGSDVQNETGRLYSALFFLNRAPREGEIKIQE